MPQGPSLVHAGSVSASQPTARMPFVTRRLESPTMVAEAEAASTPGRDMFVGHTGNALGGAQLEMRTQTDRNLADRATHVPVGQDLGLINHVRRSLRRSASLASTGKGTT
jgi:hypothetical protein